MKRAKENRKNRRLRKEMARDKARHEYMCDDNGNSKSRFGKSNMAGKGKNIPNVRQRKR